MWLWVMVLAHEAGVPLRCCVFEPGKIEYLNGQRAMLMVLAHKVAGPLRCRVFEPGEIEYLGGDIAFFGGGA